MFEIAQAVRPQALEVIVEPGQQRASQGNDGNGGRGFEAGNEAEQVTGEDEESEGNKVRDEFFVPVANDLVPEAADEALDSFEEMLQSSGPIDRKASADQQEHNGENDEDEHFHGDGVADGCGRVLGPDAEEIKEREDGARKEVVQEFSKG